MNPIPGPILLLALPLLAAGLTLLVRRWALLSTLISATTAASLALLCLRLPLDRSAFVLGQEVAFGRPVAIVGRQLTLDPAGQMWLAFVFGIAAVLYLLAWRTSPGRSFFFLSLIVLSLYASVVLLQAFPLAVIVLAISATVAILFLQRADGQSIRGSQRYLIVTVLAVPFLLIAAWLIDESLASPENAAMLRNAVLPAILGFALLLAVFPFGTWMPALAKDAPAAVTAFVFTAGQAMSLYLLLIFFRWAPLTPGDATISELLLLGGMVMATSGGIMAAVQEDLGRLFGYASLSSLGILIMALPSSGTQSLELAMMHGISRSVSITLFAASLATIRLQAGTDRFTKLQGMGATLPIASFGLILGTLSLAGFPLTAGFATQWAVTRALWNWAWPLSTAVQGVPLVIGAVQIRQWLWIVALMAIVASSAGIVIGALRGLAAIRGAVDSSQSSRQPLIASLMILALIALNVGLGLYPQLFLEPVQRAAQAFSAF